MNFFKSLFGKKEATLSFTKFQLGIIGIWVGLPLVFFLALGLISPDFISDFFTSKLGILMLVIGIIWEAVNAIILIVSFTLIDLTLSKIGIQQVSRVTLMSLVAYVTFFLFTIPVLCLIILGPAVIQVMSQVK